MKNLLTVFAFAFVMLLGVQNTSAQSLSEDANRPEAVAKAEVAKLTTALDLTGDQGRAIFRALVAKEVNYKKHVEGKDANNAEVIANKKKFDVSLQDAMKKNLTEAQYTKWVAMQ